MDTLACCAGATGVLHNLLFVIADVGDICLIPAPYFTGCEAISIVCVCVCVCVCVHRVQSNQYNIIYLYVYI
jgi:aspartate/methionine/tyrosine aminotransferase